MKTILALLSVVIFLTSSLNAADFYDYIKDLEKKVKAGDPESEALLIDYYLDGYFLDGDYRLNGARSLLNKNLVKKVVEENKDPFSVYEKGSALQIGLFGYAKNEAEGKNLTDSIIPSLKELGNNGNSNACLILSYIYNGGQGNEKPNLQEAFNWALKGHELGNPIATATLSDLLINNQKQSDIETGMGLLLKSNFPSNIQEMKILKALGSNWNIQDFDFEIENTGFQKNREQLMGICVLFNKKLRLFMKLEFTIKSLSPFKLGLLHAISIQSAIKPQIKYYYEFFKTMHDFNFTKHWSELSDKGILIKSLEKAFEWNKKAIELQPDAFSKNIDLKLDNERNDPSFNWDGLFHSNVNGDSIQKINIIAGLYGKIIEENEESLSKKCEKKLAEMHEESLRQNNLQDQFN